MTSQRRASAAVINSHTSTHHPRGGAPVCGPVSARCRRTCPHLQQLQPPRPQQQHVADGGCAAPASIRAPSAVSHALCTLPRGCVAAVVYSGRILSGRMAGTGTYRHGQGHAHFSRRCQQGRTVPGCERGSRPLPRQSALRATLAAQTHRLLPCCLSQTAPAHTVASAPLSGRSMRPGASTSPYRCEILAR